MTEIILALVLAWYSPVDNETTCVYTDDVIVWIVTYDDDVACPMSYTHVAD